jgi:hypothetical protein
MYGSLRTVLHGLKRTGGSEYKGNIDDYDVCFGVLRCVRLPITIVMSVRPPICLSLCSPVCPQVTVRLTRNAFPWNLILGTFMKIWRKNKFWLKSDKNIRHITRIPQYASLLPETLNRRKWRAWVKWYQAVNKQYANTPQCYAVGTLPILFNFEYCLTRRNKQIKFILTYSYILELISQIRKKKYFVTLNLLVQA